MYHFVLFIEAHTQVGKDNRTVIGAHHKQFVTFFVYFFIWISIFILSKFYESFSSVERFDAIDKTHWAKKKNSFVRLPINMNCVIGQLLVGIDVSIWFPCRNDYRRFDDQQCPVKIAFVWRNVWLGFVRFGGNKILSTWLNSYVIIHIQSILFLDFFYLWFACTSSNRIHIKQIHYCLHNIFILRWIKSFLMYFLKLYCR